MYKAIVSKITVRPHPNADRLQLGLVHGHQVVVGLNVQDGDLGIFFPTDGQLSEDMCLFNHLYNESTAQKLGLVDKMGGKYGFFSDKRRLRAQKFRGEKSDGFWTELQSLEWTRGDIASLKDGDMLDVLNGKLVCEKYYTPATLRAMRRGTAPAVKKVHTVFPKHVDTEPFRYLVNGIPSGAIITVTEKLHGTSGRYGHVPETTYLTGVRKWWSLIRGHGGVQKRWVHLNGSRNVTLKEDTGPGFYGTHEFRYNVTKNLTLFKGEIIYFEIVGFVKEGSPIMESQNINKAELAEVRKTYGDVMRYTYGCNDGEQKLYVYRITHINENGVEVELPWWSVKRRAQELGLKVVPEVLPSFFFEGFQHEWLEEVVGEAMQGESVLDGRHIREGVVVRVDSQEYGTKFLKAKSWLFGSLEGYIKDNDAAVDLEEVS